MKKRFDMKNFKLLSLVVLVSNFIFAQNEVGLSIQGIASDSSNTPIANATGLSLSIAIYTTDSSNVSTTHVTSTATVTTDDFGVFSYVLPISSTDFEDLEGFDSRIKVMMGSSNAVLLDQSLYSVPFSIYAQSASNGVPVGAILPFTGTTIPAGYLLCNGDSFPSTSDYDALAILLGSRTTPDLRGVYLRGHGSQTMTYDGSGGNDDFDGKNYSTASLLTYDPSSFESHRHIFNMLTGSPKDDNQVLNQVSGQNRWELNYSNKVNPTGRSDGDLRWRLWDEVITGNTNVAGGYASSAKKVSDGGGKYAWLVGYSKNFIWGGDGPIIYRNGSASERDVQINAHQHRIYGQTWYNNPSTSNDATYGDSGYTPGPTVFESSPVWYNVNYIIKY